MRSDPIMAYLIRHNKLGESTGFAFCKRKCHLYIFHDPLSVSEPDKLGGSEPYLYSWKGHKFFDAREGCVLAGIMAGNKQIDVGVKHTSHCIKQIELYEYQPEVTHVI